MGMFFFFVDKTMAEMGDINVQKLTIVQQAIASCCGAIITSLFVTPLDVIKTRLQAQSNPFHKGKYFVYSSGLTDHVCVCENAGSKAWHKKPGNFKGTLDAFVKIIRIEGIKSLWSGLPPTLIMAIPTTAIYFTCYDQLSEALKNRPGKHDEHIPVIAGSLSRSMYWYNYERFKKMMCKEVGANEPTFFVSFTSGAASGSIAAVVTQPFDVVKTYRQTQLWESETLKTMKIEDIGFAAMKIEE
ncbi:Solute carrier family 25 member 40 [Turdus rufiventris]|nr:Solute carrier family 25 member 40 [Turdus rufiventris]